MDAMLGGVASDQLNDDDSTIKKSLIVKDEFFVLETICIIWFSIELVVRFYAAPDKLEFSKQIGNIIDLFSIMPYFMQITEVSDKFSVLRIIRLVRVFRIFKLVRHFKGLQILFFTLRASANELALLVFFILIGVILFSSVIYFVELDHPKTDFNSIFDGCWYSIITMTTVRVLFNFFYCENIICFDDDYLFDLFIYIGRIWRDRSQDQFGKVDWRLLRHCRRTNYCVAGANYCFTFSVLLSKSAYD